MSGEGTLNTVSCARAPRTITAESRNRAQGRTLIARAKQDTAGAVPERTTRQAARSRAEEDARRVAHCRVHENRNTGIAACKAAHAATPAADQAAAPCA